MIEEKFKKIDCIICDADGTITDGKVAINAKNEQYRFFCVKDGLGIYLWKKLGFKFGVITGDKTGVVEQRAKILKADYIYTDCMDKRVSISEIIKNSGLKPENIAFVGDDLIDIPVFRKVGLAVAVNNASSDLDPFVNWRTSSRGGDGALRELIELILKAKGKWKDVLSDFASD